MRVFTWRVPENHMSLWKSEVVLINVLSAAANACDVTTVTFFISGCDFQG